MANVQNASPLVFLTLTPRLPGVFLACLIDRLVYQMNPGKKRIERKRSRVTETIAMV